MLKHLDAILVAVQLLVARKRKFAICISTSPGEAANLLAQSPRQIHPDSEAESTCPHERQKQLSRLLLPILELLSRASNSFLRKGVRFLIQRGHRNLREAKLLLNDPAFANKENKISRGDMVNGKF
jgi:hypothetical protein